MQKRSFIMNFLQPFTWLPWEFLQQNDVTGTKSPGCRTFSKPEFGDCDAAAREERMLFQWLEFHYHFIGIQVAWNLTRQKAVEYRMNLTSLAFVLALLIKEFKHLSSSYISVNKSKYHTAFHYELNESFIECSIIALRP